MGVDYVARKSAKKRKKKERQAVGKDGVAQRERRRKKIRRLCQGVCYKAPELTEEDRHWSDNEDHANDPPDSDIEEAIDRAQSQRGTSTSHGDGDNQAVPPSRRKKQPKDNRKLDAGASGTKNSKSGLSTSVQLLDPAVLAHNARQAALRKLPAGAKAEALELFPALLQACMLIQHHVEPTPVQDHCWPPALAGKDVQGVAEPGSGKTLAYLLPGLVKLQTEGHTAANQPEGPAMIVLLPTRELAQQVAAQCRATRAVTGLRTVCVYGGAPREEQAALLAEKRPHVLVATPGRLLDLVDGKELKIQGYVRYVVLDEADKMLSWGFKPQLDRLYDLLIKPYDTVPAAAAVGDDVATAKSVGVKKKLTKGSKTTTAKKDVVKEAPQPPPPQQQLEGANLPGPARGGVDGSGSVSRPQVLLFSATMPTDVAAAAAHWLRRPEVVHVSAGGANAISRTITQVVHVCAEHKKPEKLLKHLAHIRSATPAGTRNPPRLLVFANRVKTVRFLATTLAREGYKVAQLHGQRSQTERNQAVADFRGGKAQVLIATDVAARGLDIRSLPYVVNYDFPTRLETYVHRVGRTGRLAAYGHSYSFFTRNLAPLAPPLLELLQTHEQSVDPNLAALAAAWKVAEEKLGGPGAAAAAARLREVSPEGGDGEGGEEEDDEGDAAAGAGEKLSLAEEVLGAAEDLMEGLGPKDARAIAALVRKKLNQQQQQRGQVAAVAEEGVANGGEADGGEERGVRGAVPPRKKARRETGRDTAMLVDSSEDEEGDAPAPLPAQSKRKVRPGDMQLVPTTQDQRRAQQQLRQALEGAGAEGGGRQAAFIAAAKFTGPMQGYVYKRGPQGLGYYADKPLLPVSAQRTKAAAAGSVKAPAAAAVGGKAKEEKDTPAAGKGGAAGKKMAKVEKAASAWGLPTRNKPIIPVRHSDFLSDSNDEGGGPRGRGAKYDSSSSDSDSGMEEAAVRPVVPVANGNKGTARAPRTREGALSVKGRVVKGGRRIDDVGTLIPGGVEGGAESDSDMSAGLPEGGRRAQAKKKHKALPGRLRKKLAKARGAGETGK